MLTAMTEADWAIVLQVFQAVRTRRGEVTWRALPAQFGHWNSIWKPAVGSSTKAGSEADATRRASGGIGLDVSANSFSALGALLLCQRIEDYVTADTPFRVIDTFVQARREEARIWPVGADDDGAATLRKRLNLTVLS